LNAPLYPRENEPLEQTYLNLDHLVNYYLSKGLSKEKLILGITTYGRTFTLSNPDKTELGSVASGPGSRGKVFIFGYFRVLF
jgi:chitinase